MSEGTIHRFHLRGEFSDLLERLFKVDKQRLCFGIGGWCLCQDLAIPKDWTRFRDYLMEGFVSYDVRIVADPAGATLEIRATGSNRDRYLGSYLRHVLSTAKIDYDEVQQTTSTF